MQLWLMVAGHYDKSSLKFDIIRFPFNMRIVLAVDDKLHFIYSWKVWESSTQEKKLNSNLQFIDFIPIGYTIRRMAFLSMNP